MKKNILSTAIRLDSVAMIILGLLVLRTPLVAQQNSVSMLFNDSRVLAERAIWSSLQRYLPATDNSTPLFERASNPTSANNESIEAGADSFHAQTRNVSRQDWLRNQPGSRAGTRRARERPTAFARSINPVRQSHELSEIFR
jgi:hypothetical protein